MARLEIRLLGSFQVTVDGGLVTDFESDSARALLAFLAAEPGRVRSRAVVAEMLWPERPEGAALSNLRHVLSVLRRALGDSKSEPRYVLAGRSNVSLAMSPETWVDLGEFEALVATPAEQAGAVAAWDRASNLWRGSFLEGLHIRAGAEWEEWQVVTGERLRRQLAAVLRHLVDHHARAGELNLAISTARRLIDADPWDERGHRQLMRLLALTGKNAQALIHFADLRNRLDEELASAPATETVALSERIREGRLSQAITEIEVAYPRFLAEAAREVAQPMFVGRDKELGLLDQHLQVALNGHGRVALVAGEAGSGKTMLAAQMMKRASAVSGVLGAWGRCNAYGGLGDPYLPFREVLGLLSGDVESNLGAGAINREQATRLWEAVPLTARLIIERGPSLLGVMVNGNTLLERAQEAIPGAKWLDALASRVASVDQRSAIPERMQPALFDEYTSVLEGLAAVVPLMLVVDDLQWADRASIALLWHLARRLEGQRILILGLYRPEEIAATDDGLHPFGPVLNELRTTSPDCTIELGPDRAFIDAFLDTEPNELDRAFRDHLFAYTNGHPLFTVEMVRGLRERAEVRRNQAGVWTSPDSLDWHQLPRRIEAVIGQRIAHLSEDFRRDLEIAAVQGEEFVAEAVAAVRKDEGVPSRLSRESTSMQRLIKPAGVTRLGDRQESRHRFRHVLFQRYLYDGLDNAERMRLHEATGRALEDLYRDHPDPPVVDLAHHFDAADMIEPAISYLQQAGERAVRMSASEEAIRLLQRSLELVAEQPASSERDSHELALLVSLAAPVMAVRGYATKEAGEIGTRVQRLCDTAKPSQMVAMARIGVAQVLTVRAQHGAAAAASREALAVAEQIDDDGLKVLSSFELGYCQLWMGALIASHRHLQLAHRLHDSQAHAWLMHVFGIEPGAEALVWDSANKLLRGYNDQARVLGDAAIALARQLGHPFTLCHVLGVAAVEELLRGEYRRAQQLIDELESVATFEHFPYWSATAHIYRGWEIGYSGDPDAGIASIQQGFDAWHTMGAECHRGFFSCPLAEFHNMAGRPERGLALITEVQREVEKTDEHLSQVYLQVERGRLSRILGADTSAHVLSEAMQSAKAIGARLAQLKAATELATLHLDQCRREEASKTLAPVYDGFTEGFDTADLLAASKVLERC